MKLRIHNQRARCFTDVGAVDREVEVDELYVERKISQIHGTTEYAVDLLAQTQVVSIGVDVFVDDGDIDRVKKLEFTQVELLLLDTLREVRSQHRFPEPTFQEQPRVHFFHQLVDMVDLRVRKMSNY